MSTTLSGRFAKGTAWLMLTQVLAKFLAIARIYCVAQLVPQDDVGLFTLAIAVGQFVEILGQTGLGQALIQRPGDARSYAGTVFFVGSVRGLILTVLIALLAPVFEWAFHKPGLGAVLVPMSLISLIGGVRNVGVILQERELDFVRPALLDFYRAVWDSGITIVAAWFWPSVWALVVGQLSTFLFGTVLSYVMFEHRVRPVFRWSQFAELYRFGFWFFWSSLLTFFMVTGSSFVVAGFRSNAELATYSLAYMFGCTPTAELCRVITRTSFSAFSRLQATPQRAIEAYQQVFGITCTWIMLVIGLATLLAPSIARILPSGYAELELVLPWLALWGASRAMADVDGSLLQGLGKPVGASLVQGITFVAMFASTIPMCHAYGIRGVAWSLGAVGVGSLLLRAVALVYATGMSSSEVMLGLSLPSLAALLAGVASHFMAHGWFTDQRLLHAISICVLFCLLYTAVWLVLDRWCGTRYAIRLKRLLALPA